MSPRWIIVFFVSLFLFLGMDLPSVYADSSDGTVSSLFQHQSHSSQTKNDLKNGSSTAPAVSTSYGDTNLFLIFLKLIFALLIVLALIYLLYHFAAKRTGRFQASQALKNLGGISVGSNRSVQLVRIGEEILVVGVGDTVNLIKEIKDPQIVDMLTAPNTRTDTMEENVLQFLKRTADRAMKRKTDNEEQTPAAELTKALESGLNTLKEERMRQVNELLQEAKHHD